jgi:hypothetical protein
MDNGFHVVVQKNIQKERQMAKRTGITKRRIQEILAQSAFTPSEPNTPFAQVVQFNNPQYGEYKAIELIQQAQLSVDGQGDQDYSVYVDKITQAISILALSRAQRETIRAKTDGKIRTGSKDS